MIQPRLARLALAAALTLTGSLAATPALAAPSGDGPAAAGRRHGPGAKKANLRIATFNLSLNRNADGELVRDLSTPDNVQARTVAEIIQRTDADIILLNEFDYVADGRAVELFRHNYLEVGQNGARPVHYPYAFTAPVNTGVPSGFDLNNDGAVGGPDDAYGFGLFPGQYGMVVLSKHPIDTHHVRTFQKFLWKDMPGALLPDDPKTPAPADWYSPAELAAFRLSSKSHWDVPITVGRDTIHVLASHPTPPTFDGPEDRNGRRNHDEIRFWSDYISPQRDGYLYDDRGVRGGLRPNDDFVILGDMNADPVDGDSYDGAIRQLLGNHRIVDPLAHSAGGEEATRLQGGANLTQRGAPRLDTADFADTAPGNLRVDYTLLSHRFRPKDAQVFWPVQGDPLSRLTGVYPFPSSDHRLVWVDASLR